MKLVRRRRSRRGALVWHRFGEAALLIERDGPRAAQALADAVRCASLPGVSDVVPGMRSVLVVADPGSDDPSLLVGSISGLEPGERSADRGRTHRLPTVFDGPDLAQVAAARALGADEVVALLRGTELEVVMLGFSPGFAYLDGLPRVLKGMARHDVPRPIVDAGSVALGGDFAALYAQPTPGGWQLVGRTDVELFDPGAPPFSLLQPGDRVRFIEPGPGGLRLPTDRDRVRREALTVPRGSRPGFAVEDPGLLTTVQDAGRTGVAHLGVPGAGPADPVSHALGNALVGNRLGAAAIECTGRGPSLRCLSDTFVAVSGGDPDVSVDGHPIVAGRVAAVVAGQQLVVGSVRPGLRTYVAAAGGLVVETVLESMSTDTLSGLGGGPLMAGDELGVGEPLGPLASHVRPGAPRQPTEPSHCVVRVVEGPHPGWFAPDEMDRLGDKRFTVGSASNRVGLRLEPVGEESAILRHHGEADSAGMVTGAVQVLPGGKPVLLLPDHATLGGYPVVAVVIAADRCELGQCRPGDTVEFHPVGWEVARAAWPELQRAIADAITGRYPTVPG